MGILISQSQDPYKPTCSIMESRRVFFVAQVFSAIFFAAPIISFSTMYIPIVSLKAHLAECLLVIFFFGGGRGTAKTSFFRPTKNPRSLGKGIDPTCIPIPSMGLLTSIYLHLTIKKSSKCR